METTFIIWVVIACTQIFLFTIYLTKFNKKEKDFEEIVDIVPVCNYNGNTYWLDGSYLYREKVGAVTMNKERAERIDQLNAKDLSPSEVIHIVDLLGEPK